MAILKRLIQNPSSPNKNLKILSNISKSKQSTFARLSDVNALSISNNDTIAYTLALTAAATGTQAITSKKGVIKITTSNTGALTITLTNSEILLADVDKYFVSATVSHPTLNAVATAVPIAADGSMAIRIAQITGTTAWTTVYLTYTIVKIGD